MADPLGAAPYSLRYAKVQPMAFPSVVKLYQFQPQGFLSGQIGFSDYVRILVQLETGFWDPYSAHINLTVDFTGNTALNNDFNNTGSTNAIGYIAQLDGSAHSHFDSLIIYKDGAEWERLNSYDILANILQDMNYSPTDRRQRENEGVGGILSSSMGFAQINAPANFNAASAMKHYLPMFQQDYYANGVGNNMITLQSCAPYLAMMDFNLAPQQLFDTFSNPGSTYQAAQFQNIGGTGQFPAASGATIPLSTQWYNTSRTAGLGVNLVGTTGGPSGFGILNPFPSNFALTCMEPKFSGIPCLNFMDQGQPGMGYCLQNSYSFPLLSGIFGILMPADQYKMIPLKAMRDVLFEFKMNPYAYFTSNVGCPRSYRVNQFELEVELTYFDKPTTDALEGQLDGNGIILSTYSFYLGPPQNIAANAIPGSVQINLGFSSLKSIHCVFINSDYLSHPGKRKLYRLSQNITSFQVKVGTDFYPQQPITGNAGTNLGVDNNSEFYMQMLRAFNKLHQADSQHVISTGNYAINYTLWDQTFVNGVGSVWNIPATAMNVPNPNSQTLTQDVNFYFENAQVGKALFSIDMEGVNYGGGNLLTGVDTMKNKPFEILFQYSNLSPFPRNSVLYTFCHYNLIIQMTKDFGKVWGRG